MTSIANDKAGSRNAKPGSRHGQRRIKATLPCLARAGNSCRTLPFQEDLDGLVVHLGSTKAQKLGGSRLARYAELMEMLRRVRLLEALMYDTNKRMSVDETLTTDIHSYKVFRNGLFSSELMANIARYEAHILQEIAAMQKLLRMPQGVAPPKHPRPSFPPPK